MEQKINIDVPLVKWLINKQFAEWSNLSITPVEKSGWDNKTFHLGDNMLVRLPSARIYEPQVEKEQKWLPKFAKLLPLEIPIPLAKGEPCKEYPFKWSIYAWLKGDTAGSQDLSDEILVGIASQLAKFLSALQNIDTTDGPAAGAQNFYRGSSLDIYDAEARKAINILRDKIDAKLALELWDTALATRWTHKPVWVHGDISPGNLIINDNKLCAVIDFGILGVGDPACDLVIAWTLFRGKSRDKFRKEVNLDKNTWARARAWALWKAAILSAKMSSSNEIELKKSWFVLQEVLAEYKSLV